jgi:hypothetical protein
MATLELRAPAEPVCPGARKIEGAAPQEGGVVCVIKEMDAEKADPILEGTPTGVVIRWGEDPLTLLNVCCGQGEPMTDPDDMRNREMGKGHYTGCPIWAAAQEWNLVERLWKLEGAQHRDVPGGSPEKPYTPGLDLERDLDFFTADGEKLG